MNIVVRLFLVLAISLYSITGKNVDKSDEILPTSCLHLPDGYHPIKVGGSEAFNVNCNSTVAGSGWTVIQRRSNSRLSFNQTWQAYVEGFGNLRNDFFIGLNKLHLMTKSQPHELFIYTIDWFHDVKYGKYDSFLIDDEANKFALKTLGQYNGTLFDVMESALGNIFRSHNNDRKCISTGSGWWRKSCLFNNNNPNGDYYKNTGVFLKYSWFMLFEMMIRPANLTSTDNSN